MATDNHSTGADVGWQERAVERSLRTARERALSRSERFIAAATQLLNETGRTDFTVQEIVERSKMSLRSFYQHFASKDELLLALFEEAIRNYIDMLRTLVEQHPDPIDALRTYVTTLYETVEGVDDPGMRALSAYHLQLADSHPTEFARALAPQIELLSEILERGAATGQVRTDVGTRELAMILTQSLVAALHLRVLGVHLTGAEVDAAQLWAFFLGGIIPPAPGGARTPRSGGSGVLRR